MAKTRFGNVGGFLGAAIGGKRGEGGLSGMIRKHKAKKTAKRRAGLREEVREADRVVKAAQPKKRLGPGAKRRKPQPTATEYKQQQRRRGKNGG